MVVAEVPLWVVHSTASGGTGGILSKTAADSPALNDDKVGRASESLSLLESVGGGAKKAAIYSIDMHPTGTKFATGGGDGAVRLWNAASLFAKSRGSFQEDGAYQSSSGAESEGVTSSGGEDNAASDATPPEQVHDLSQLVRRKKDGTTPTKKSPDAVPLVPSPSLSKKEFSHHHHRLLCTLSAHTGSSVLAVRFSTSGQYLASAGDDAVVCIYAPSSASGNLDQQHHVEHWTRIKLCRGHTLDVVGLAWAPDDSHLVSCSLDSDAPIIVWKLTDLAERRTSNVLCNPYKILGKNVHTSTVKGVTFDPAGTYLASSGDDPAVCIWRAHDDWGLEKRIDDGIFRKWKEDNAHELSSQTLFRRLSWSTDGTYICSTNGVVKNKHVASTISREGWSVSSSKSAAAGAANLVGHKQPVVVSRHCPRLFDSRKGDQDNVDDDDDEPEYATLIALGDKRGFVTVWSTRKARPIFKLQCSESRCTVTDLSWGPVPNGKDMILLVSLLDGQVVALRFGVPNELGPVLSDDQQNRVFQLRYGIDLDDDNGLGRRRMFVGDNSGPKLIENALQLTLEEQDNELEEEEEEEEPDVNMALSDDDVPISQLGSPKTVRSQQSESRVKGKKRIRPVLMSVDDEPKEKKARASQNGENGNSGKKKKKSDPAKDALESAAKAASAAESISAGFTKRDGQKSSQQVVGDSTGVTEHAADSHQHHAHTRHAASSSAAQLGTPQIPHSTNRIHSIELPHLPDSLTSDENGSTKIIADCTNVMHVPKGSSGQPISCTTLSISRGGKALWRDEITGTTCSAIAGAQSMLAVGSADGAVYLYGTSPALGWASAAAVRSHPPLILGQAIVSLQLKDSASEDTDTRQLEMLVVTADGSFGVYRLLPDLKLCYKGSILPAMTHMILSSYGSAHNEATLPKLARIQMTESNHLLMILSLQASASRSEETSRNRSSNVTPSVGVGGGLQAFVYDRSLELWMRVADSRFILSDFYSTLPATKSGGVLYKMEDAVRSGSVMSSLKPSSRRVRDGHGAAMFHSGEEAGGSNAVSRSHCEDRMACAAVLGSAEEFKSWLLLYIRTLTMGGHVDHLRLVVDMLLGSSNGEASQSLCWWLSLAPGILNLDRKTMVKTIVVPEMSKNRALQRVTNEIAMQVELG